MGNSTDIIFKNGYTPVGDMISISLCLVVIVLIQASYVSKKKSFVLFSSMVFLVMFASLSNILYNCFLAEPGLKSNAPIYIFRFLYHVFLFLILFIYILYVIEVQQLEINKKKWIMAISTLGFLVVNIVDLLGTLKGFGFKILEVNKVYERGQIFLFGYIYFVAIIMFVMIKYRKRLYAQVMTGFYGTMIISFLILFIQGRFDQTSFTTVTFVFPIIAMLYLIHSNPYDLSIGAVSISALEDMVKYNYKHNREFIIMSMYLPDFDEEGLHFPAEIQAAIRKFASSFFRGAVLFQISNGHVMLVADIVRNPDYENRMNQIINAFQNEYARYHYDYKIVMGKSLEEISKKNEYVSFINHIHRNIGINLIHFIEYDDVTSFNKQKYIIDELSDIYRRHDLDDSRIEVYCQPVYNMTKKKYDTAEALMRLKLPEVGLVFPDQFISLAEDFGYIHVLSLIILNKTCKAIRKMLVSGYEVKRISVNISVLELRDDHFCEDINKVIKASGIPDEKIAIEITESQNESDFLIMKSKINELKEHGIKFYLDDFGTGYSNIERIMELPFDIIKFDRSLVTACGTNPKSEQMVGSLAAMFDDMNYSVLYEGVENELDEKRCIEMSAKYLQGYKYSRPIPIERLTEFFEKRGNDR